MGGIRIHKYKYLVRCHRVQEFMKRVETGENQLIIKIVF